MKGPGSRPSLLFQLVVPATAVFVITILALIAVLFSDPRAPVAIWLNRYGNQLLAVELVVVMMLSFLAMAVDRWRMLKSISHPSCSGRPASESLPSTPESAADKS